MALVGKNSEKNNQNLMQLIRRAHGLVENPDLEKHRQSQDHIGELLGNSKEIQYRPVDIDGMDAEWVSVNRAHMKKYVILHCHGGGYSTGSSIYARTLTSKLAAGTSGASVSGSCGGCHESLELSDAFGLRSKRCDHYRRFGWR